jgi:hypothetical protein
VLFEPQGIEAAPEARLMLKPGVLLPGQNLELEHGGHQILFLPQGVVDRGEDYEVIRCRPMLRDTGE